jgi:hypothetical protein
MKLMSVRGLYREMIKGAGGTFFYRLFTGLISQYLHSLETSVIVTKKKLPANSGFDFLYKQVKMPFRKITL